MEKSPHFRGDSVHTFGMPLYAQSERVRLKLNSLDSSVLCPRADVHTLSGKIDSLVMKTVYIKPGTDIFVKEASGLCMDSVADLAAGRRLLHVVEDFPGH